MSQDIRVTNWNDINISSAKINNAELIVKDKDSGLLARIDFALMHADSGLTKWSATTTYNTDDIVEYNELIWKSLVNNNLNNPPVEGANWTEVSAATDQVVSNYAVGVYTLTPTLVVNNNKLYLLNQSQALPFESVDFAAEETANIWLDMTGSGGGTLATYLDLTDTPSSYPQNGMNDKAVVNNTGDGLTFLPSTTSNGFDDVDEMRLSFDVPTGTLNLFKNGGGDYSFVAPSSYTRYTKTTDSIQIAIPQQGEEIVFIYYDNTGTLQQVSANTRDEQYNLMQLHLPVSYVITSSISPNILFIGDYCQARTNTDQRVKNFFDHRVRILGTGLKTTNVPTSPTGDLDTDAQFGLTAGELIFTNRKWTVGARAQTDVWNIGYTSGVLITGVVGNAFPVLTDVDLGVGSTGRVVYNNNGSPTAVADNDFVWYFVLASNDITEADRTLMFMGNEDYGTQNQANNNRDVELNSILSQLPVKQGLTPIRAILYRTRSSYGNAVKARIERVDDLVDAGLDFIPAPPDLTLSEVLQNGNDANTQKITNLANGTDPADAVNKSQLDAHGLNDVLLANNDGGGEQIVNVSGMSIDKATAPTEALDVVGNGKFSGRVTTGLVPVTNQANTATLSGYGLYANRTTFQIRNDDTNTEFRQIAFGFGSSDTDRRLSISDKGIAVNKGGTLATEALDVVGNGKFTGTVEVATATQPQHAVRLDQVPTDFVPQSTGGFFNGTLDAESRQNVISRLVTEDDVTNAVANNLFAGMRLDPGSNSPQPSVWTRIIKVTLSGATPIHLAEFTITARPAGTDVYKNYKVNWGFTDASQDMEVDKSGEELNWGYVVVAANTFDIYVKRGDEKAFMYGMPIQSATYPVGFSTATLYDVNDNANYSIIPPAGLINATVKQSVQDLINLTTQVANLTSTDIINNSNKSGLTVTDALNGL